VVQGAGSIQPGCRGSIDSYPCRNTRKPYSALVHFVNNVPDCEGPEGRDGSASVRSERKEPRT